MTSVVSQQPWKANPTYEFTGSAKSFSESPRSSEFGLELDENARIHPDILERIQKGLIDPVDVGAPTADDFPEQVNVYRRKVKKIVEVPVIKKVKVPTVTQQIVPEVVRQTVKVTRHVPVESFKWVEEAYIEVEEQPSTRMKEIWVKKLVPETYMKKVEVRKMRKVKVPTTTIQVVEEEHEVEVPTTKIVDVQGFRIDELKDTKLVEIEGWQEVELVPRIKDTNIKIDNSREIAPKHRRIERKVGQSMYDESDDRLNNVDTDSDDDDNNTLLTEGQVKLDGNEVRSKQPKMQYSKGHRFVSAMPSTSPQYHSARVVPSSSDIPYFPFTAFTPRPPNSTTPKKSTLPTIVPSAPKARMFGFRLIHNAHGLLVTDVSPDGFAADARMKPGEIISHADGVPVASVKEWKASLARKANGSTLRLTIINCSKESEIRDVQLDSFDPNQYK